MDAAPVPSSMSGARLPRWCLPDGWPAAGVDPALATLRWSNGRIVSVTPDDASFSGDWNLGGAPVLPGFVEAHTHIDKAYTQSRLPPRRPGLLAAIDVMQADRADWTAADVRLRATRCLETAWRAGVVILRTHCDWWEADRPPLAWAVLGELRTDWGDRLEVQRVALMPLPLFHDRAAALRLARLVAAEGPGACLGAFVHSSNWDGAAVRNLFEAAQTCDLDVDLHCDEELNPAAQGLASVVACVRELDFRGRVVCGHACALAAMPDADALRLLDAVAAAGITLVALPITNLLLQDADTGRTPRLRGITLVKEARSRGIPLLIGTDNVQDAFCRTGSFDPVDALAVGALAAQFEQPFDTDSEMICRADWLVRGDGGALPLQRGSPADWVAFTSTDAVAWPAGAADRVVVRGGRITRGVPPERWSAALHA